MIIVMFITSKETFMNKRWIWQHDDFPNYTYDKVEILKQLQTVEKQHGELLGKLNFLSTNDRLNFVVQNTLDEIISNSAIEGVYLQRDSVRSSILKKLGYENIEMIDNKDTKHTDNLAEIVLDTSIDVESLSIDRLHRWHFEFFQHDNPDDIQMGSLRDEPVLIAIENKRGGVQRFAYEAPPAKDIRKYLDLLIDYCNLSEDNGYVKSGIAHLLFETIHPYEDGNGRIGRVLANYVLSKELGLDNRYMAISWGIIKDKRNYYEVMERTNRLSNTPDLDITQYLSWYIQTVKKTLEHSNQIIDLSIKKTKLYDHIKTIKINDHQRKIIEYLYDNPGAAISTNLYKELTGLKHSVTASRQIKNLVEKGLLINSSGSRGRSTSYTLNTEQLLPPQ